MSAIVKANRVSTDGLERVKDRMVEDKVREIRKCQIIQHCKVSAFNRVTQKVVGGF